MDSRPEYHMAMQVISPERRHRAVGGAALARDSWDHGPSPEESLRIMRAFVGIKNRQLRADLIEMLESASRTRGQAPRPKE
jgi:hypothetical protein